LRRASRTSVLGPRFLGIASGAERGRLAKLGDHAKGRNPESAPAGNRSILGLRSCALTINAWALEDLTGLATGTETVAFDLEKKR
jgi:hypothetical protein